MNRNLYRTIFSKRLGALVPVAEVARAHGKGSGTATEGGSHAASEGAASVAPGRLKAGGTLALAVMSVLWDVSLAAPLPAGGTITQGAGAISQNGNTLTVNQSSQQMSANWQSFSIGADHRVVFNQPNGASIALNRVIGPDVSAIYGNLSANGQVFLVNPNGVLFAPGSQVSVGGLAASTLNISDADFAAGRYRFTGGSGAGSVVNAGHIDANSVVLIGPRVINSGTIATLNGQTTLAAGDRVTVSLMGGLLTAEVDAALAGAEINNHGQITADGGKVSLLAGRADSVLESLINTDGLIRAGSLRNENGKVYLDGGAGGTVRVAGSIDASGLNAGERGGEVRVLGDQVTLANGAIIDVSGQGSGGTVLVGGDFQGKNGDVLNASRTVVEAGAAIRADGAEQGGRVIVWSNDATRFAGDIYARGKGFAEVSGKGTLSFSGNVDTGGGTLLLDPTNITVQSTAGDQLNTFSGSQIATLLASNNVLLNADNNITWNSGVTLDYNGTGNKTLTLQAGNNISYSGTISDSVAGGDSLNVIFNADADGNGVGSLTINNGSIRTSGGDIVLRGGSGALGTLPAFTDAGYAAALRSTAARNVVINWATLDAAGGNIIVRGAGIDGGSSAGVSLHNSTIGTSGASAVSIDGIGGNGSSNNRGVLTSGTNVSVVDGTITLQGMGNGTGNENSGLRINTGTTIQATGAGNIVLNGLGGTGASFNDGLVIDGATVRSNNGNIAVTGTGRGTGIGSDGVELANNAVVEATGAGNVTLDGTSTATGANTNRGVTVWLGSAVRTTTGALTLEGESADPAKGNGINVGSLGTGTIGGASQSGNITLTASSINLASGAVQGSGSLLLQPLTSTDTIGLGDGATGSFNLTSAELARLTDGFSSITIGRNDGSGAVDIRTAAFKDPLTIRAPAGSGSIAVSGTLSGTDSITLQAGGEVSLSNGTVSAGGALSISGASYAVSGTSALNSNTLTFGNTNAINNTGTLTLNQSANTTIANAINGTGGSLVKAGTNTLTLTGNNAYTGTTTIDAGTLQVGNGGTTGTLGTGAVTNNSALAFNRSDTIIYAGNIGGTGSLTQMGPGTLVLAGTNTYTGDTIINGGMLALASIGSLDAASTIHVNSATFGIATGASPRTINNNINLNNGTILNLGRDNIGVNTGGTVSGAGNDVVHIFTSTTGTNSLDTSAWGSDISAQYLVVGGGGGGAGGNVCCTFQYAGGGGGAGGYLAGTTTLSANTHSVTVGSGGAGGNSVAAQGGNSTFAGITAQGGGAGGIADFDGGSAGGAGGSGGGGGSTLSSGTNAGGAATVGQGNSGGTGGNSGGGGGGGAGGAGGAFNAGRAGGAGIASSITGVSATYAQGGLGGSEELSGVGAAAPANTGSGGGGGNFNRAGGAGGSGIVVARYAYATDDSKQSIVTLGGSMTLAAGTTNTVNIGSNAGSLYTITGTVSGAGALTKSGAGTLTLTGTNTYTGTTTISGGTLQIGDGGTTGTLGTGAVTNNGSLVFDRADSYTVPNLISGTGSITQAGTGTTILTANNTYSGTTTVADGTLQVGNNGTTGTLGTGAVTNNANLVFDRFGSTSLGTLAAGGITGTGNVTALIGGALNVDRTIALTGANSTILLEAGKNQPAGTASGGDVTLTNNISTSAGGTITIFSGNASTAAYEAKVSGATGATRYKTYNANAAATGGAVAGTRNYYYRQAPTALSVGGLTATKVYDGLRDVATVDTTAAVVSGLIDGDTLAPGALNVTGARFDSAHAGARTLNANVSSATAPAYSSGGAAWLVSGYSTGSMAGAGTGTITPKQITTSINAVGKTYDGLTSTTSTLGTPAGFVGNDSATGVGGLQLAFDNPNAGTRNIVASGTGTLTGFSGQAQGNGSGIGAGNEVAGLASDYAVVTPAPASATISAATLTIRANNDAKIVTQADPAGYNGVSFTGFVNGESAANLGGALTITRSNAGTEAAGNYAGVLTPSGYSSGNYTITYVGGDFRILPAQQLLVRIQNVANNYGVSTGYAVTSAEYLAGDGVTFHTLTLTAQNGNTYTYSDGAGGSVTFTIAPENTAFSSSGHLRVGNYQLSGANTSITGNNFTGLHYVGNQAVNRAAITPSASGISKVYDGTTALDMNGVSRAGLLTGDVVNLNGSGTYGTRNAGTNRSYYINGLALSGADADNYYLTAGSLSGNDGVITPRQLTVTAVPGTKVYDGTKTAPGTPTVAGSLVTGDSFGLLAQEFATANVGTNLTLRPLVEIDDGNGGANYELTLVNNTMGVIRPAAATLPDVIDAAIDITKLGGTHAASTLNHDNGQHAGDGERDVRCSNSNYQEKCMDTGDAVYRIVATGLKLPQGLAQPLKAEGNLWR